MRFVNPILFVTDIGISTSFYADVLGLAVAEDHGNFVRFEAGFALHEGTSLARTVWGPDTQAMDWFGCRNILLYFEHDDIDALFANISMLLDTIHPIETQPWGQRVFRFYDPDRHAVEVGEPQVGALAASQSQVNG